MVLKWEKRERQEKTRFGWEDEIIYGLEGEGSEAVP
jgi:hypothetical protein